MLAPLLPGHILRERYKICQVVGRGGMGCVYQAEDLRLDGRLCAVKEIQPDPASDQDAQLQTHEQFRREASVLARLDHPNLPKVSDFFSEEGRDFLVMDYVPGHDLKTIMDASRREGLKLPQERVMEWAEQLCDSLAYLHRQNPSVLHRDIKPGNIKLTPGGLLKLVDFGLVKLLAPDDSTITVIQGRGTALYTPLEQYGGETGHTDIRSDLYSLGATLYHLVTCQPPVEAKQRFLTPGALPSVRSLAPEVSKQFAEAIEWAMALHPDDRPSSVQEFQKAMLGKASVAAAARQPDRNVPWRQGMRENRGLFLAAAALLLLAILTTVVASPLPSW